MKTNWLAPIWVALLMLYAGAVFGQEPAAPSGKWWKYAKRYRDMGYYISPMGAGRAAEGVTLEFVQAGFEVQQSVFILAAEEECDVDCWVLDEEGKVIVDDVRENMSGLCGVRFIAPANGTLSIVVHFKRVPKRTAWMAVGGSQRSPWVVGISEATDIAAEEAAWDRILKDDTVEEKGATFDPSRVSPRHLQGGKLNLSDAVIELDVPKHGPKPDYWMVQIHPSYRAAMDACRYLDDKVLPSINLIDALAKQFDDGLCAALALAEFEGRLSTIPSQVELVRGIFDSLPANSPGRPFLAAALELAEIKTGD